MTDEGAVPDGAILPGRPPVTFARGLLMGVTDAVPGVSGGTIALILGIHPRLVRALAGLDGRLLSRVWAGRRVEGRPAAGAALANADAGFLVTLGIGLILGLLAGAQGIVRLLDSYPQPLAAAFLALVVAGAAVPWRHRDTSLRGTGVLLLAALLAFALTLAEGEREINNWALPAYGALAASAMILPGISGSYVLLLLGAYPVIIHGVAELDLVIIAAVGAGALFGLLAFSRFLRAMLTRHHAMMHSAMVGLLLGSVGRLWPWRDAAGFAAGQPTLPTAVGLGGILVGAGLGLAAGWALTRAAETE